MSDEKIVSTGRLGVGPQDPWGPEPGEKTPVMVRLDGPLLQRVDEAAEAHKATRSAVIRECIRRAIKSLRAREGHP